MSVAERDDHADVLIVGAGVIGMAVAWKAAAAGLSVIVCDPEPGRAASWAAAGMLAAYLTPNPGDGQKHPAIVWITGGDCHSIGDGPMGVVPGKSQQRGVRRAQGFKR